MIVLKGIQINATLAFFLLNTHYSRLYNTHLKYYNENSSMINEIVNWWAFWVSVKQVIKFLHFLFLFLLFHLNLTTEINIGKHHWADWSFALPQCLVCVCECMHNWWSGAAELTLNEKESPFKWRAINNYKWSDCCR